MCKCFLEVGFFYIIAIAILAYLLFKEYQRKLRKQKLQKLVDMSQEYNLYEIQEKEVENLQTLKNAYAIAVEDNKILQSRLEKIKEVMETALKANYCNNCDGVGLPDCGDYECHTYALDKIMDIIEGTEDD